MKAKPATMDPKMQASPPPTEAAADNRPAAPPPGRTPWGFFALGVLSTAAVAGGIAIFGGHRAPTDLPASAPPIKAQDDAVELAASAPQWRFLEVAKAEKVAPISPVPAPARVLVDETRSSPVFAPLAGRVEQVAVQLGQEVKAGAPLVSIRSSTLPELNREIESARAALAVKTTAAERVRDLVKLGAVPEKDMLLAEQERREAELELQAAQGKKESLRIGAMSATGLYWVTAPRAGTVVERRALVGEEAGPDRAEPLVSVADLSEVIVVADVPELEARGIAKDQKAEILAGSNTEDVVQGTVVHVGELVDPVRRTVGVRLRAVNTAHTLRPNAFAQVRFPAAGGARIVVPTEAVVTDGEHSVVFVEKSPAKGDRRLERRRVKPGRSREGRTEILEGLAEGETFVSRGALLLLNALNMGR